MDKDQLKYIVEALIFASDSPISIKQINDILQDDAEKQEIEEAIELLNQDYQSRSIFLKRVSGGYQFSSRPEYSKWLSRLYENKLRSRLSRAALEVLSIIAFKQPISKVEISAIRGVNSDGVIKGLLERRLITIIGRDRGPGRALLFETTKDFLQYFSLDQISDLPKPKEIEDLLAEGEGGTLLAELPQDEFPEENPDDKKDDAHNSTEETTNAASENVELKPTVNDASE
ncbi:MAG: SMC-Scp complex subunit ScpB [Actinobacteria bacterium]|nr:SMC-Scp complex subunit ScpB [Actinomycetota bacterium]